MLRQVGVARAAGAVGREIYQVNMSCSPADMEVPLLIY